MDGYKNALVISAISLGNVPVLRVVIAARSLLTLPLFTVHHIEHLPAAAVASSQSGVGLES